MGGGPAVEGSGIGSGAAKNKMAGVFITSFSAFGGILFGYDTGTISGIIAMGDWLRTFGTPDPTAKYGYSLSSSRQSLVVSILSAGTFFGALLGAPVADIVGRKHGIHVAVLVFCVGVAMQTASTAVGLFVAGRAIAGLGVGMLSILIPMYQSECAPKWIRGAVVACYQWAITIGLLLSAIVNNATKNRSNHSSYRIPIAVQFVWAFILATGMFFLTESPRWLVKQGRDGDAAHSFARLLYTTPDDPEVQMEVEEIRANLRLEQEHGESSYLDCFRPSHNRIRLRTLTGIFIQAWQQLTGVNFISYYGTTLFLNSGITNPFLTTIATNVVGVGMTILAIWGVDRFGRRNLLLIGAAGMCFCEFLIAIVGVTISVHNVSGQKVLIAFVCVYFAFFASTWGPIPWIITGEIFPLNVRAKAMSMSVSSNWLWNWALAYATPYLVNSGAGNANLQIKVFFIWGTTCFCCIIFTYFCVPETKGLSLEEIDLLYQNTTPINSIAYRRDLKARGLVLTSAGKVQDGHLGVSPDADVEKRE